MEEGTQKALMVGIPLAIAGIGAALYFATREAAPFPVGCNEGDEIVEQCPDGSYVVTHTCQNGQLVPTGLSCPICNDGDEIIEACWDGSLIVTQTCQNGQWQPTGLACPIPPTPECTEGATQQYDCPWGQIIITNQCRSGQWVPTGIECPPTDCLPGEVQNKYCWDGNVIPEYECKKTGATGKWHKTIYHCPIEPELRHYIKFSHVGGTPAYQYFVIDFMWCRDGEYGECTFGSMQIKKWDIFRWRELALQALNQGSLTQTQHNTIVAELENLGY